MRRPDPRVSVFLWTPHRYPQIHTQNRRKSKRRLLLLAAVRGQQNTSLLHCPAVQIHRDLNHILALEHLLEPRLSSRTPPSSRGPHFTCNLRLRDGVGAAAGRPLSCRGIIRRRPRAKLLLNGCQTLDTLGDIWAWFGVKNKSRSVVKSWSIKLNWYDGFKY